MRRLSLWSSSSATGVTSQAGCVQCPAGRFEIKEVYPFARHALLKGACFNRCHVNSNACRDCPLGKSTQQSASQACLDCRPGLFQDQGGQLTCKNCPQGRSAQNDGSSSCALCSAGKYNDQLARANCKDCQLSQFNPDTDPRILVHAVRAPKGNFLRRHLIIAKHALQMSIVDDTNACQACPSCSSGRFRSGCTGRSQGSCEACPTLTFNDEGNSNRPQCKTCASCPAGQFRENCGNSKQRYLHGLRPWDVQARCRPRCLR